MLVFSPQLAFALEAFVHFYAASKNVLLSTQSKKKSVNFGDHASFWCWHQTPCEKHTYLFVWKHERSTWKKMETWKKCMENVTDVSRKMKNIYGKRMNLTEPVEEYIVLPKKGKVNNLYGNGKDLIKKSEEFLWTNNESVLKSERNFMFQGYSKYIFVDVNFILKYFQHRFSSSIPGMPAARGNQNFTSIFSVGWGPYI